MRQQCKLYDVETGRAQKLGRYHKDDICGRCLREGYTLEDAPTFQPESVPDSQATAQLPECVMCGEAAVGDYGGKYFFCAEHWEQLHNEGSITVFSPADEPHHPPEEVFDELFRAGRVLFANHVTDEDLIIPTLVFAHRTSFLPELQKIRDRFSKIEDSRESREQFSSDFSQRFKGLVPVSVTDGMLNLRRVPISLDVSTYPGTTLTKEIEISVFTRSVMPEDVAERYRQVLAQESIPCDPSRQGLFRWKFSDAYLSVVVSADKELDADQAAYRSLRGSQLIFPPPQLIADLFAVTKGSVNRRRFRGFAYALGGRQSGTPASPGKLIPACIAWYLRERGSINDKHRLARLLNRHLLSPCGKSDVDVTSDQPIWENIDRVADSIMRVELALQNGCSPRRIRVSKTRT